MGMTAASIGRNRKSADKNRGHIRAETGRARRVRTAGCTNDQLKAVCHLVGGDAIYVIGTLPEYVHKTPRSIRLLD
jgi:hypothetical protein